MDACVPAYWFSYSGILTCHSESEKCIKCPRPNFRNKKKVNDFIIMIKFTLSQRSNLLGQYVIYHGFRESALEFQNLPLLYLPYKKLEVPRVGPYLLRVSIG